MANVINGFKGLTINKCLGIIVLFTFTAGTLLPLYNNNIILKNVKGIEDDLSSLTLTRRCRAGARGCVRVEGWEAGGGGGGHPPVIR